MASEICLYIMKHIQSLDAVLTTVKRNGVTTLRAKSQFCIADYKIVELFCDSAIRHPDTAKVLKIIDWPECQDLKEVWEFMGVIVYYRI